METLFLILALLLIVIGLLGCVVPGIPGSPLILLGALVLKLSHPLLINWWLISILALMTVISSALNIVVTGYTAQKAGASRLGILAATLGAFIGIWMSFLWIFLLPLLLAFGVEYGIKQKKAREAAAISARVGFGLFISTLLQIGIALLMILFIVIDWLWI